jgi:hypothetical protein
MTNRDATTEACHDAEAAPQETAPRGGSSAVVSNAAPAVVPLHRYLRDNFELVRPELISFSITLIEVLTLIAAVAVAHTQARDREVNGQPCWADSGKTREQQGWEQNRALERLAIAANPDWWPNFTHSQRTLRYTGQPDAATGCGCQENYEFVSEDRMPQLSQELDGVRLRMNVDPLMLQLVNNTFGVSYTGTSSSSCPRDCELLEAQYCGFQRTYLVPLGWQGSRCAGNMTVTGNACTNTYNGGCGAVTVGKSLYVVANHLDYSQCDFGLLFFDRVGVAARTHVSLLVNMTGFEASVTRRVAQCQELFVHTTATKIYWWFRTYSAFLYLLHSLQRGLLRKPLVAPMAYSMQASTRTGAMVRILQTVIIIVPAMFTAVPFIAKGVMVLCTVACCAFAVWAYRHGTAHGIFGIMNIYLSVSLMLSLTVADLIVGLQGETATAVVLALVQALITVRELLQYTTGGYISYSEDGANIRAADESTFKTIKERKIPWHQLLGDISIYTAPLRQSSDITSHMAALIAILSDGPIMGGAWFAAAGGENEQATATATLVLMPVTDTDLIGKGNDGMVYYCIHNTWYAVDANGAVQLSAPMSGLVRLSSPAIVR